MSGNIIDSEAIQKSVDAHDKNEEQFHAKLLESHPDKTRCCVCSQPLKKVRMTRTTTMKITIRSRMTMPIVTETRKGTKGYTRQFQKQLHDGIAKAIMAAIEHQRDDNYFDQVALDDLSIEASDFGIKGEPEISDFADLRLTYHYKGKKWKGEVLLTKAERGEAERN